MTRVQDIVAKFSNKGHTPLKGPQEYNNYIKREQEKERKVQVRTVLMQNRMSMKSRASRQNRHAVNHHAKLFSLSPQRKSGRFNFRFSLGRSKPQAPETAIVRRDFPKFSKDASVTSTCPLYKGSIESRASTIEEESYMESVNSSPWKRNVFSLSMEHNRKGSDLSSATSFTSDIVEDPSDATSIPSLFSIDASLADLTEDEINDKYPESAEALAVMTRNLNKVFSFLDLNDNNDEDIVDATPNIESSTKTPHYSIKRKSSSLGTRSMSLDMQYIRERKLGDFLKGRDATKKFPDPYAHAHDLLQKYSPSELTKALKKLYGEVPENWLLGSARSCPPENVDDETFSEIEEDLCSIPLPPPTSTPPAIVENIVDNKVFDKRIVSRRQKLADEIVAFLTDKDEKRFPTDDKAKELVNRYALSNLHSALAKLYGTLPSHWETEIQFIEIASVI